MTGNVCASRGLGSTGDRNEWDLPELGGRLGFEGSSAETDLLEGEVCDRERVNNGFTEGA